MKLKPGDLFNKYQKLKKKSNGSFAPDASVSQNLNHKKKKSLTGRVLKTFTPKPAKWSGERAESLKGMKPSDLGLTNSPKLNRKKKKNWIAGAIKHPGALRRELGVKQGHKIPAKVLSKAAKKPGVEGKRARLAQTLKSFHHKHKKSMPKKCKMCK
jgi:hypothetical protein